MRIAKLSIEQKITAIIMSTVVANLLLIAVVILVWDFYVDRKELFGQVVSIADILGQNSAAAIVFEDKAQATLVLEALRANEAVIAASLYDNEGKLFAFFIEENYQAGVNIPRYAGDDAILLKDRAIYTYRPVRVGERLVGTVFVKATLSPLFIKLWEQIGVMLLVMVLVIACASLMSFRLRKLVSAPIKDLAKTASIVASSGNASLRAIKSSDDEIGILVDQFNNMLEQISTQSSALKSGEFQLKQITDSLPVLISYVDRNEVYRFNNVAFEKWFNRPRAEITGKKKEEVLGVYNYQVLKPYINKALRGESLQFDALLKNSKDEPYFANITYIPHIEAGSVVGYFSLISDVTPRKRIERELKKLNEELEQRVEERTEQLRQSQEKLRQRERLASVGTLAAGIAHEINNPLNSILLAAEHVKRYRDKGSIDATLDTISAEAKRCGRIIKSVLKFAKEEKTSKWPSDLNQVIRQAADLSRSYASRCAHQITLDLEQNLPPVLMNPTEIEQVLVNLINNALETSQSALSIYISSRTINGKVEVKVIDNGPGIEPEIISRVFDPFFSTRREKGGTGLGLSIAHSIIKDHDGNLDVLSKINEGTQFVFTLKIASQEALSEENKRADLH
jgi:PAS domain S-box-containing protein